MLIIINSLDNNQTQMPNEIHFYKFDSINVENSARKWIFLNILYLLLETAYIFREYNYEC